MKLAYAMVADAAQVAPDGKISLLGGDFDTINTPSFPTQVANLALIFRINLDLAECEHEHRLRITLTDPAQHSAIEPVIATFTPHVPPGHNENQVRSAFVLNFPGLPFEMEGIYAFHLAVDDENLGEVLLRLVHAPV